ncbi:hypothetical protein Vadar_021114 [Vaccinium darrowii]|uniref:Uncharacterized protein n=1 Tax=Vaccinium darrowii TaxID=229202 RepID=A0ACB7ZE70_9ERIC|nr:hypothetical protein Vadar_021114 [Vaccinium darrowii]
MGPPQPTTMNPPQPTSAVVPPLLPTTDDGVAASPKQMEEGGLQESIKELSKEYVISIGMEFESEDHAYRRTVLEKEDWKNVVGLVTNAKLVVSSVQDVARKFADYAKFRGQTNVSGTALVAPVF